MVLASQLSIQESNMYKYISFYANNSYYNYYLTLINILTIMKGPGILDFSTNVLHSVEKCIAFLREKCLLAKELQCVTCSILKKIKCSKSSSDGQVFQCHKCKSTHSIRKGSIFAVSRSHCRTNTYGF